MVTDILFNFYDILVNTIFGSVGLAIIAVAIIIALILMVCRASSILIIYWLTIFLITMFSFYFGSLGLIIGFIISLLYFLWSFVKWTSGD